MVSPTATTRSAPRTSERLTRSRTASTRRLRKPSISCVTSGKTSWERKTKPAPVRLAAFLAARPMMGGSVSATTTSGRPIIGFASQAEAK